MELMETSLDKFYKFVYGDLQSSIPEDILGKITVAVSAVCVCVSARVGVHGVVYLTFCC